MQLQDSENVDSLVPLFDVVISMPSGAKLETIQQLATTEAGLPPDRVERLIKVLRSSPNAKVGSAVSLERAEEEKARFTKAGLHVEITPLLTVQATTAGSYDGLEACPACGKRAVMPKNRQCPSCGVFVDKLTDEYLLRKKVMQQERGAMEFKKSQSDKNASKSTRESMEASIREQVREELYGKSKGGLFKGKGAVALASLAAVAMGLLYMGEKGVTIGGMSLPWGKKETPVAAAMSASSLQASAGASPGASPAGGAGGAAGAGPELTGDADVDDILIQAAAGKKPGGKGLTMEEAVAASKALAKSVGNTTAERALAGGSVGGPGAAGAGKGAAGASVVGAGATASGQPASADATAAGGNATATSGGAATDSVPKLTKQLLTAEFSNLLAELGQVARAREVLKALAGGITPADTQAASALQAGQIKLQAWTVLRMDAAQARQATEDIKAKTQAIANPQERTLLQGQVAAILSRSATLPPELPRVFLSLAAESLKAISGAQSSMTLGNLAVSMAEVFMHETTARAKTGAWTKAKASAAQVEDLIKQAPDAWTQARLYAVDHQAKLQIGQTDKAAKSLELALALAGKNSNLAERAMWLRTIAQLSDAGTQEQFEAVANSLQSQLNGKSGLDKAQGLTELYLLYTAAGLPGKAAQLRSAAQATAGLSPADSVAVNTDLIVRGDMVMAKTLHVLGRYAEAETVLQRVSGYLF